MAYIGIRKNCASYTEMRDLIWGALEEMGWTLYDNIDSNTRVYSSKGEGDSKLDGFIKIYYSNYIYFEPWLFWDNATHVGSCKAYCYDNYINTYGQVGIYGDKDFVWIKTPSTSYQIGKMGFGHVPNQIFPTPKAVLAADSAAGESVTVTVDSTSGFVAGNYYRIVGTNTNKEGRDKIQVESITDATHMVIVNMPRVYKTNAVIAPMPIIFGSTTYSKSSRDRLMVICWDDVVGNENGTSEDCLMIETLFYHSALAADKISNYYSLVPIVFRSSYGLYGYINSNILITEAISEDTVVGVCSSGKAIQGQASSGTDNTLVDSSKSWTVDELIGKYVAIIEGSGVGAVRKITDNDATSITVETNWDTNPDATSIYRIVDEAWRCVYYISGPSVVCRETQHALSS